MPQIRISFLRTGTTIIKVTDYDSMLVFRHYHFKQNGSMIYTPYPGSSVVNRPPLNNGVNTGDASPPQMDRVTSAGIATGYVLDDRMIGVRFPAWAGNFSLRHHGPGAHPASYRMGTGNSFPGVKRPGREADHSPPAGPEIKECVELYFHSPSTSSWCGA
jgi:hypothetical protein